MDTETNRQVQEYVSFLDTTLRPNYQRACAQADQIRSEMDEYRTLQQHLNTRNASSSSRSTMVDLGFGVLSCEAISCNEDSIFVHVGMGFHVDLRQEEAQALIHQRLQYLTNVWKIKQAAADAIKNHIFATEQILDELARLKNFSS